MVSKTAGKKTVLMAIGIMLLVGSGNLLLNMLSGETTVTTTKLTLAFVSGFIGFGILYLKYRKSEMDFQEVIGEVMDKMFKVDENIVEEDTESEPYECDEEVKEFEEVKEDDGGTEDIQGSDEKGDEVPTEGTAESG